jgi:outer membrane protein
MMTKTFALAACAAAAVLALSTAAAAQTPASAAATPAITYGPPIAGVCTVSVDAVVGNSTVGKYVETRLRELGAQVNAELSGEKTSIDNEAKTLEGQRASMDQNTLRQRATALQARENTLEQKAAVRERELQATQQQAVGRVINEMKPLIASAAEAQHCSILIDRSSVILVNPSMDLTPTVVTALNGKITQFAFDRVRAEQGGGAGAPPVTQTPSQAPTHNSRSRK